MQRIRYWIASGGIIGLLLLFTGCASQHGGRVTVVLDNSGSMAGTGTEFEAIKESLFHALLLIPGTHESGLRVFDEALHGSRLVSPYSANLEPLERVMREIQPETGTYIGQALVDAAQDLLERPQGRNYLVLVTDGEGDVSDIERAREVRNRLAGLPGGLTCNFILFSTRGDVWNETPIGRVAAELGCGVTVAGGLASAKTLTPALLRIFGFNFYWLWIILSALAYLALIILTAYLVFDIQYAQGVLPRLARVAAIGFVFALLPAVLGAHLVGLFAGLSSIIWGLIGLSGVIVILAAIGIGKSLQNNQPRGGNSHDPFA